MKIIIFAGGTGKRLWPLSRKDSPKQFHKLFGEETTLENSYNTIKKKFEIQDIFISTNTAYVDHVKEVMPTLPEENIIIEPEIRDTGAAVAFAMTKISLKFPDEPVLIRWQNSLIKEPEAFIEALNEADKVFSNNSAEFVYLCVPAKYPNTGVGYIEMGEKEIVSKNSLGIFEYKGFTEKPDLETAKKYEQKGNYGWNPGCYITTPRFVLKKLSEVNPEFYGHIEKIKKSLGTDEEEQIVKEEFSKLEKKSIDYLLWEHLKPEGIKVVLADYDWHYVSTWSHLKEALSGSEKDVVVYGNVVNLNSKDALLYNFEKNKLLTAIGLEGYVVVNTEDAILVVPKDKAGDVKELLAKLEDEGKTEYL